MTLAAHGSISPCLWFDSELEEAAGFYTSVFPNSAIGHLARYPHSGEVMAGEFTLDGTTFRAINGGPVHAGFTETISFSVTCADQAEVDHYWESLTADGGEPSVCGWLKDRFGLSWQIVPRRLYELMEDPDPARATAATEAMLQMRKIVVAELEAAADAAGR
ncbi:MAG TPA: VOC family protein [Nocardioides sp.]|uniref:VOC family protein n=1 Tax=uncultured Nocardioides sp. TaxID=198441 RepID=UPI002634E9EB|nr:VOC family protein [uncultured Nocardioides sp.]HRI97451.1 VOC family protein [Nocardioides sp.]HRK47629.1 VOC family protein [Nocardioides sp.]